MAKRVIDGEGMWHSDKLSQINPPEFRPEYAWLLPLANAWGRFEISPRNIWAQCYASNRPGVSVETVEAILAEFERVGLLFRYMAEGKPWGFWNGIQKEGRLPPESHRSRYGPAGPVPPADDLNRYITEHGGILPVTPAPHVAKHEKPKQTRRTVMVKPSLDEVRAYCQERGNRVDPAKWLDHYMANGWKVGRNPMVDWRSAVRKWEGNGVNQTNGNNKAEQRQAGNLAANAEAKRSLGVAD